MTISLKQKSSDIAWTLEPMQEMYFVWPDLIKSSRELYWSLESSLNPLFVSTHYESIKLTKSGNDKIKFLMENINSGKKNVQSINDTGKYNIFIFIAEI